MNATTLLLLQLAGPTYLVLGLGMMLNPEKYLASMKQLKNNGLFLMWAGAASLIVAAAILNYHFLWETPFEILVSLIGVGAAVKGLHIALSPASFIKNVERMMTMRMMKYGSLLILLVGAYMTWGGYFA
ncbi:hypothetical protein HOI18_03290 [Candidatus Uhrbacteria bacterium]|jgi:hypothetical protein|nr:hypothetical protein [Candidatus Uhrbacteria bacterium]